MNKIIAVYILCVVTLVVFWGVIGYIALHFIVKWW